MIRRLAASAVVVSLCLAGCQNPEPGVEPIGDGEAASKATPPTTAEPTAAPEAGEATAPAAMSAPAAPGAPAFAALYPGAQVDGAPTQATGAAGDGGLVTFRTAATPDEVVAFYRERAEGAGLRSVMGMNQGDARAYGAAGGEPEGASLQVVAAPGDDGETSVQLSWSEGL
jgi:hypothetical protein